MQDFEYINKELGTNYKPIDNIDWDAISKQYILSESFIEKFQDKLDWHYISAYQKLSEDFIEKHQNKVKWILISTYQKLSEPFIEKHKDDVIWYCISKYQKLSENFIQNNKKYIVTTSILKYQKLSENFIQDYWFLYRTIYSKYLLKYQKLSDDIITKYNLTVDKNNLWQYQRTEFKKQKLIEVNKYECHEDYFIAYKAIRNDRYSLQNFQYQYLPGETYESSCDCTDNEDSFGLNVGTYSFAKNYLNDRAGIIVKCKVYYKDIGRIVHNGDKVRCFKITVLE